MSEKALFFFIMGRTLRGDRLAAHTQFDGSNAAVFDIDRARAKKLAGMVNFNFNFEVHFTARRYNYLRGLLRTEARAKTSVWREADHAAWLQRSVGDSESN